MVEVEETLHRTKTTVPGMQGYDESTYGRAFAEVYDDWYGDDPRLDDLVTTVTRLASSVGGAIIELGAGTGRLTAPIAERLPDRRVIAIDSSTEMLERLAARPGCERVERVRGDMVDALPNDGLSVVLASYNTVFNLTDRDRQALLLRRVATALNPGGHLAIETEPPLDDEEGSSVTLRHMTADTVVLAVSRQLEDQRLEGHFIELRDSANTRLRPWSIRWLDHRQLAELAQTAGLTMVHHGPDWPSTPDHFEVPPDPDTHGRRVSILRRD